MFSNKNYTFLFITLLISIPGCKFDTNQHNKIYNTNFPVIYLYSYIPYEDITPIIKNILHNNHILYFDCTKNTNCDRQIKSIASTHFSLYIDDISTQCTKTSLFQDGQSAEHQIILTVILKIKTQKNEYYKFIITVSRIFFNNPIDILANSVKKRYIIQLMYQEASEKIMKTIYNCIQNNY